MVIVLDASAGLSLLAASQTTAASESFRQIAPHAEIVAPSVFRMEMRHVLLKLERRGLVSSSALDADLLALERVVAINPAPSEPDLASIVALARAEGLGAYDAALLEAAKRRGISCRDLR